MFKIKTGCSKIDQESQQTAKSCSLLLCSGFTMGVMVFKVIQNKEDILSDKGATLIRKDVFFIVFWSCSFVLDSYRAELQGILAWHIS